ncbi:MAG: mechanosensitive ion channel family protein [Cyclobacteriaceae bacterium]|nr:mechanosensitive ion channel family protein [Cyclobacteriaceae bacterium]
MMRTFIAFLFSISYALSSAQDSKPFLKEEFELSSPYHTVLTHLKFLQDENYKPDISAKVFDEKDIGKNINGEQLAIKLKQILDGKGMYIDLDIIPKEMNYKDSITYHQRYYINKSLYPQLYVEKKGQNWFYSASTITNIPIWHKEVYPYGTDKLLSILPKVGHDKYLGLYLWQILGILFLIVLSFVVHKIFTFLIEKILLKVFHRLGYVRIAEDVLIPVAKPISYLLIFVLLTVFVPVLQLPIGMNKYVTMIIKAVWPVFAIIFFYRLVDILSIYFSRLAEKTKSNLDDQLVPLVRKILKTFVVIIGVLFIFNNLDYDITGLIAGLSIGGLAFALAAQDTIKNFFGSIMIFVDKPFQVGDWITSGDIDGTVEEVGFRSTRIRTFRNSVTYVPNGVLTDRTVDNHGLRAYRRFYTQIAINYDTPPELIELFVEGLREIVNHHPVTRKDAYEIYLNGMADSSLNIMFYIFFEVDTWSEELKGRHEVLLSIIKLAQKLGINFAFPTQTLHMETFPEKKGNKPLYESDLGKLKSEMNLFLSEQVKK